MKNLPVQRDIGKFQNEIFDIIIIGGGVTGASIAWDASLRGMKVALIEKKDFGHATSAATSKLIHGGLRYLENFEFSVVRESLRERRLLEKNMPHLAFPLPFIIPVYNYTPVPSIILRIGLFLYDLLALDKNELPFPEKFLPNHQWLSRDEVLQLEPRLNANGLKGGFLYYDVLNKYPERANMEYILSAANQGASIANYMEFKSIVYKNSDQNAVAGIVAEDKITGEKLKIKGELVINAAGPWVDETLKGVIKNSGKKIIRSKGIHILLPKINQDCAIAFSTKDKKHFFIIPWLNYTLIGTTDENFTGNLDKVRVSKSEALEFLNFVKEYYPIDNDIDSILHAFAGIRPLAVNNGNESTYSVSRRHEIIDHKKSDKISGLYTVIGGKWTTSRNLAEIVINKVIRDHHLKNVKSKTSNTPVAGGMIQGSYEQALHDATEKHGNIPGEIIEHLFSYYGNEYKAIVSKIINQPKLMKVIDKLRVHTLAEIEYAVEKESVVKLSDFLMRRSSIGNTGIPDIATLREITDFIGKMLGWDEVRKKDEIKEYVDEYKITDD